MRLNILLTLFSNEINNYMYKYRLIRRTIAVTKSNDDDKNAWTDEA